MWYGGPTLDIRLRRAATHDWLLATVLGFLTAIGAALFLFFLSPNIESSGDTATTPPPGEDNGCDDND